LSTQENLGKGNSPQEFLALVTMTEKSKKEGLERESFKTASNDLHRKPE
jgi:hypothetical protein